MFQPKREKHRRTKKQLAYLKHVLKCNNYMPNPKSPFPNLRTMPKKIQASIFFITQKHV
jgi:hypothetical protein